MLVDIGGVDRGGPLQVRMSESRTHEHLSLQVWEKTACEDRHCQCSVPDEVQVNSPQRKGRLSHQFLHVENQVTAIRQARLTDYEPFFSAVTHTFKLDQHETQSNLQFPSAWGSQDPALHFRNTTDGPFFHLMGILGTSTNSLNRVPANPATVHLPLSSAFVFHVGFSNLVTVETRWSVGQLTGEPTATYTDPRAASHVGIQGQRRMLPTVPLVWDQQPGNDQEEINALARHESIQ